MNTEQEANLDSRPGADDAQVLNDRIAEAAELARTLGPFAKAILVETAEGSFAVPVEDMFVGRKLREEGHYNPQELETLRMLCNSQTRLLVVGAHIGALTIPLARNCHSVTAIEANPRTFELLKINVELNGLTNCRIIQKAASNRVEAIQLVLNRFNSGVSKRMPIVLHRAYFQDNPEIALVMAAPLDELLPGESFDVVLMDIEGSEYFAFLGMQRILTSAKVLQVEFIPHHLRNVAGVSVADFLKPIRGHFTTLVVPDKRLAVGRDQFESVLTAMDERDEWCEALVFMKVQPGDVQFP